LRWKADIPKLDTAALAERVGVGYPTPFTAFTAHHSGRRLCDAGGLTDLGVNLARLPIAVVEPAPFGIPRKMTWRKR